MATRTIAPGGGNWSVAATWTEVVVPTSADEVVATGASGNLTVDTATVCRSIDLTGYVGTLTINNANSLAIGDATLPTGSVALKFPTGMTVACNTPTIVGGLSTVCGLISFVSTAAGVQTVDFNSDNVGQVGSVTFDGTGGSWQLISTLNASWWSTVTLTRGTLDFNGQTCDFGRFSSDNSNVRTLTLGAAQIQLHSINASGTDTWATRTVTNLTVTANTATVTLTQEQTSGNNLWASNTINFNGLSVIMNGFGALHTTTGGSPTLANFTVIDDGIPDAGRPWYTATRYQVNNALTVTGTLTFMGYDSGRRLRVQTNSGTSLRTFTVTGATVMVENVDFLAIGFNVAQNFSTANAVGDESANSAITFPTGATQYFYAPGAGYKRWSYPGYWFLGSGGTGGAGRCPLPQDSVRFDASSFDSPGATLICDVPRIGGNGTGGIDWTGVTNSPTWHFERTHICYGDMKLSSGMSLTSTRVASMNLQWFAGATVYKWTTATQTWPLPVTFNLSVANSVQLQDDIKIDSVTGYLDNNRGSLTSSSGGLDCNNFSVTCNTLSNSSGLLTMGSGTFTLTGRGTVWSSGGTISAGTSLIRITNSTRLTKTFSGNGRTYNNIELVGSVQCNYNFSGSNTFNDFKSSNTAPHKILFTAGTTTTVTTFDVNGDASNRIVIKSITTASHTLTKAGGGAIVCDYVIVERSTATPAATWSVTNGVDGGNNTDWGGFTSDPFTWTGATNSSFSVGTNWFGGVAPGSSNLAFFHTNNIACTLDAAVNVRGMYLLSNYTSTITQAATLTLGNLGWFQTGASTFTGATQKIVWGGDFIQLAGTFTPSSGTTEFDSSEDQFFLASAAYTGGNILIDKVKWNAGILIPTATKIQDVALLNNKNKQTVMVAEALPVNKVYKSTDGGLTWDGGVAVSATAGLSGLVQLANGWILGSAYDNNTVYKSTDGGATWDGGTLVHGGGSGLTYITQLANGWVLVGDYGNDKVYTSLDNGATWDGGTLVVGGAGIADIEQIANGDVLAVGFNTNKVYRSIDNGATWDIGTLITSDSAGISAIKQLISGDVIVVGALNSKMYLSIDNGATWNKGTVVASGSGAAGICQLETNSQMILVSGQTSNKVYQSQTPPSLFLLANTSFSTIGQSVSVSLGKLDNNGFTLTVNSALDVKSWWRSTGADKTLGSLVVNPASSTIELFGGNTIVLNTAFATDLFNLIISGNRTITMTAGMMITINGIISPSTADMFNTQATPNRGQCQIYSTISGVMWKLNLQGTSTLGPAIDIQDCDARYGNWFECKGSCYLLSHACKHLGNYRCIEKPTRAGQIYR